MNLHEYIKPLAKADLDDLAARCGTSAGQLKQIAYGNRRPNASLAINIERETKASVTCEELRPDIDWAYLRNTQRSTNQAA
ncbi:transcriptional regulator [Pseudomonas luteola]|uniref:transcriptional regulator n=1 Tax=Pseudomonas luteola TaxID=47886 RepID=UPI001238830B|nr:YdaS family helix-turn-helix protein [Pseudomonas luteola]QEU28817.1 helix-turn-helix domain-containing protein [Pseudomonas luteola]